MRIVTASTGGKFLKISRSEWEAIGSRFGWEVLSGGRRLIKKKFIGNSIYDKVKYKNPESPRTTTKEVLERRKEKEIEKQKAVLDFYWKNWGWRPGMINFHVFAKNRTNTPYWYCVMPSDRSAKYLLDQGVRSVILHVGEVIREVRWHGTKNVVWLKKVGDWIPSYSITDI